MRSEFSLVQEQNKTVPEPRSPRCPLTNSALVCIMPGARGLTRECAASIVHGRDMELSLLHLGDSVAPISALLFCFKGI